MKAIERTFKRALATHQYTVALNAAVQLTNLCKEEYGTGHLRYAKGLVNIGFVCKEKGDYESATKTLREALNSYEELVGASHRSTLATSRLLAQAYEAQGKHTEAAEVYRSLTERCSINDAREYAKAFYDLGRSLNTTGHYTEAVIPLTQSLEIIEQAYGSNNLLGFDPRLQLIKALNRQGKAQEAHSQFKR